MIIGLGIDLCPISRMEQLSARWGERIERRLFTDGERSYCLAHAVPARHMAARFAAKEATLKALAVPRGLTWHEMEVVSGPGGKPSLVLAGEAAAAASRLGVTRTHISLTHDGDFAVAVVVFERD